MRVLVVGSGAREHALCWRLHGDPGVVVWVAPGNDGCASVAQRVRIAADDHSGIVDACRRLGIDLAVIGPEAPLVAGLADRLRADGIAVLGPSAASARIEGSKRWARAFCARHRIPAPEHAVADTPAAAAALAARWPLPAVCKADGLMAGKGVVVARTREAAVEAAAALAARGPVVFESYLAGQELSGFSLCDGRRAVFLGAARDHKQLLDGGLGPMTGGMGACTPPPDLAAVDVRAVADLLAAAAQGLADEGLPFVGILFAGLMLTDDGPQVLEFNCRLGDPEAQCLLPLWGGHAAEAFAAAARGGLPHDAPLPQRPGAAVGIVLAAPGYPEAPRRGDRIAGLGPDGQLPAAASGPSGGPLPGPLCFHGACALRGDRWVTDGGRVLTVAACGPDLETARTAAYGAAGCVTFSGRQWRSDIGLSIPATATGSASRP